MVRMSQTFTMDSRIPVGANVSEDDPNHPKNVTKLALMTSAQANADTKYDIYPPPRVENFANQRDINLFAVSLIVTAIAIYFLLKPQNLIVRFALIATVVLSLHYATGRLENHTV